MLYILNKNAHINVYIHNSPVVDKTSFDSCVEYSARSGIKLLAKGMAKHHLISGEWLRPQNASLDLIQ